MEVLVPTLFPKARLRSAVSLAMIALLVVARAKSISAQQPSAGLKQADADYRAGVQALSRNDLNTALDDFEKVVHLAPAAYQGHSALGAVLLRQGRVREGISELEKALAIQPSDASAQLNLAVGYQQNGQPAKALGLFSKLESTALLARRPLAPATLDSYAHALAAAGQQKAAIAKMKQAAALEPNNADFQNDLGTLYAQQEDWPDAKTALSTAVRARPDFAGAHLRLGLTLKALQYQSQLVGSRG